MYIDNYDDNTKYTKYMIVLDYYTHTEKLETKWKRKGIKDIHKRRRIKRRKQGQGKDGYIPRWHAVKSMYTDSGDMLRSRTDQDKLGINEDKTERFLWQKDLSQTKKTINLRN